MQPFVRGHADHSAAPSLLLGRADVSTASRRLCSADQTLELCLLETQRQVIRLEEIVHRLTSVAGTGGAPPTGVMSLLREGNRRLQRQVDEFAHDAHAVLETIRPPAIPLSLLVTR